MLETAQAAGDEVAHAVEAVVEHRMGAGVVLQLQQVGAAFDRDARNDCVFVDARVAFKSSAGEESVREEIAGEGQVRPFEGEEGVGQDAGFEKDFEIFRSVEFCAFARAANHYVLFP